MLSFQKRFYNSLSFSALQVINSPADGHSGEDTKAGGKNDKF
ncbi:hypothetical protein NIASO_08345 [Niabella soli DSM 19437]|uniref:Uncharacterized protein n=1 Tax=Niabella soli DSM 19437 TaxID=929713 RepID=W0F370_9BACT|nr:hypothetical protein NIASO_08345 [Niabella soli DSM 19437]